MHLTENTPNLPKWAKKIVERGDVDKALRIAQFLNTDPTSPWLNRIQMANAAREPRSTIRQGSFVSYINRHVLVPSNPLIALGDFDLQKKVLLNYWKAIAHILDDGSNSVLFKTNGLALFSRFSISFFSKLQNSGGDFTVDAMIELFQKCFANMSGEFDEIGYPSFWVAGNEGRASAMNMAAVNKITGQMSIALNSSSNISELKL